MPETGQLIDLREKLLQDLEKATTKGQESSTQTIFMGEMNKDMDKGQRIKDFLEVDDMYNIHKDTVNLFLPHTTED